MKIKKIYKKILPLLVVPFILTGCGEQSKCELPSRHVHKYTMNSSKGSIVNYIDSENVNYNNYKWNEDYIEITKDDEAFYNAKIDLFEGEPNWNYLYNYMASKHDYLEFYYHYTTTSTYTTGSGKSRQVHVQTHHHSGWDTDPTHRGVTGEVRLCHNRFYGYKIIYKDGKYERVKSNLVDDIRDIIDEYPYFDLECSDVVYKEYDYSKSDLTKLRVSDFNYFKGPDLTNRELNTNSK